MGVYIKGMEMPEHYTKMDFGYDADGNPQVIVGEEVYDVIPVPPHGRCIDADALEDNNITYYAIPVLANVTDAAIREAELVIRLKDLDAAPTIISASEERTK